MLKKLVVAAVAAGALVAIRKRSGGKAEADLWHEATRGPQAVSTNAAALTLKANLVRCGLFIFLGIGNPPSWT